MTRLAKVVDTDPQGRCGEAEIAVPKKWLVEKAQIEVSLPMRLRCHRCRGGGCDDCERSGVFRLPEAIERRRFELPLPSNPCVLRLSDPVGAGHPQLVVLRIEIGELSEGVRRLAHAKSLPSISRAWLLIAAVIIAAVTAFAATR